MEKLTPEEVKEKIQQYCTLVSKPISESDLKAMPKHMVPEQDFDSDEEPEEYVTPDFVIDNVNTTRAPKTVIKARTQICERCKREVNIPEGEQHRVVMQISTSTRGPYVREKCMTCKTRKNPFNGTWSLPVHETNRCYLVYEQYPPSSEAGMVKYFRDYGVDK